MTCKTTTKIVVRTIKTLLLKWLIQYQIYFRTILICKQKTHLILTDLTNKWMKICSNSILTNFSSLLIFLKQTHNQKTNNHHQTLAVKKTNKKRTKRKRKKFRKRCKNKLNTTNSSNKIISFLTTNNNLCNKIHTQILFNTFKMWTKKCSISQNYLITWINILFLKWISKITTFINHKSLSIWNSINRPKDKTTFTSWTTNTWWINNNN